MRHFCTLFDSKYLSRGLAMYRSLRRHCREFHLYIFAFDDLSRDVLLQLALPDVTVISLSEFEDRDLLRVKPTRTVAEYCWTCTSSTILYVLQRYGVPSCTYVDADVFFFSSPEPIFKELGDGSVLITEHRFSPRYQVYLHNGVYNVQFVTFRADANGLEALQWWRNACLDWCYSRAENGKFGDQKYLDDWPTRFRGVHVLRHLGGGVAPWNVQQYEFGLHDGRLRGRERQSGQEFEVIFYHFHNFKLFHDACAIAYSYELSRNILDLIYRGYLDELFLVQRFLAERGFSGDFHGMVGDASAAHAARGGLVRMLVGNYDGSNVIIFNKRNFVKYAFFWRLLRLWRS